ncbi:hypothetical protein N8506_01875 [Synechococcus sp. AH-601-N23]|nr:hypothetical protein [Synechococcus sp. AH-601-N23]
MGFLIFILIATVIWFYFKNKDLQKKANSAQRTAIQLQEERVRERRPVVTAAAERNNLKEDITVASFNNRESSTAEQPRQHRSTSLQQNSDSLNTGIAELDGPGMFQRLTRLGPSASAVYLLYSEQHKAYKVGYCDPRGIANRIKQIKPEVPDVKLVGTAVLTTVQNAFDAEQRILDKYKRHKYNGIYGRWSGSTEWITQRPTGRPYLMTPAKVEARYQEELEAETERPTEQDIYTVYLMKSPSKGMHKVSWCKTANLSKKLIIAQNDFANDVEIISRFPIQTLEKARAVAIYINEKAGTFKKEGRKESYVWTSNPSYLNKFKDYGPDAMKTT